MRQQNPWTTTEHKVLREAFERDANVSPRELCRLLPRHTDKSIDHKRIELGLTRPEGAKRHKPGWAAIAALITNWPMSHQEIADALGCTRSNVRQVMGAMRPHWHIAGYRPSGHYAVMTPLVILGAGENAPYPKVSRKKKSNPFLVAAGLVSVKETITGRIIKHLHDDELEAA